VDHSLPLWTLVIPYGDEPALIYAIDIRKRRGCAQVHRPHAAEVAGIGWLEGNSNVRPVRLATL
jgi:hypothetical protein